MKTNGKWRKDDYRAAREAENAADLCWQLCDVIDANFVGFESLIQDLRKAAIHFEVEFENYFKNA